MKIRLTSLDPATSQPPIVIRRVPVIIGRSPAADVHVRDCWASRRHCELDELDGVPVVRDLNSTHGTFVNGESVSEAHLLPGDRLTVGVSSFEVQYQPGRAAVMAGRECSESGSR